jgi:hypothetical protein
MTTMQEKHILHEIEAGLFEVEHGRPAASPSLEGVVPESWLCVDCGRNTAPGLLNRTELEAAFCSARGPGRWC